MEAIFIYWAVSSIIVLGIAIEFKLHKGGLILNVLIACAALGWFFFIFYIGRLIALVYIINSEKIKSKKL